MEFTESIKTAKVDGVLLTRSHHRKSTGTLCLTSHHILFADRTSQNDGELMLLYMAIEHLDKKFSGTAGLLTIITKDFSMLKFKIPGQEEALNVADSIEKLSSLESAASYYPFFYNRLNFKLVEDGWKIFTLQNEYEKIIGGNELWKINNINENYDICSSYPKLIITPAAATDDILRKSSQFRQLGRFPVLSYLHNKKVPLLRSSQPMCGSNNKKCREDQRLLSLFLTGFQSKGIIIDTRQSTSATSHRNKGGGYELEAHYPQWKRVCQNLNQAYNLGDSINRLYDACCDCRSSSWLSKLEASGWLSNIQDVLMTSLQVARLLHVKGGTPVLVHGEKGVDNTLQVTSLSQLLLDPNSRTIKGFESLITREWLWGGHPFTERNVKLGVSPARRRKQAPVFLLFLDCVYQIICQYPSSFEFNEEFLLLLAKHVYASEFGTFLFHNELQREQAKVSSDTVSLWSFINRDEILTKIRNPLYEYNSQVLWLSISPQSLVLWEGLFLKGFRNSNMDSDESLRDIISSAKQENSNLKEKAKVLQREYLELYSNMFGSSR